MFSQCKTTSIYEAVTLHPRRSLTKVEGHTVGELGILRIRSELVPVTVVVSP